jgi:hypothetical protein
VEECRHSGPWHVPSWKPDGPQGPSQYSAASQRGVSKVDEVSRLRLYVMPKDVTNYFRQVLF